MKIYLSGFQELSKIIQVRVRYKMLYKYKLLYQAFNQSTEWVTQTPTENHDNILIPLSFKMHTFSKR